MKFKLKNYLLTGALTFGILFSGCHQEGKENQTKKETKTSSPLTSQTKEEQKILLADSISFELQKYPTTTHLIYGIQKDSEQNFSDISKLEIIIKNVENQFHKKETYSKDEVVEILETIDKEIKNLGMKHKKDKFDCDDRSFIYLAVGEKLNLNLHGVFIPGHMFIRYDLDGKHDALNPENPVNKNDFNWETTNPEEWIDKEYIDYKKIPSKLIEKGISMKSLTKLELLSLGYFNKGNALFDKKEYNLSIENYDKAIELNPNDADFYRNKGTALHRKGEYNLAIKNYDKAIELNPNDADFHNDKKVTERMIKNKRD